MPPSTRRAPAAVDPALPQPYFLIVDTRFPNPVYVFLDSDPSGSSGYEGPIVRRVTLARVEAGESVKPGSTIGADPWGSGQYAEFASDGIARAAGFAPVEPRYVGPDWASYTSIFHPEGSKGSTPASDSIRRPRGRNGSARR